MRKCELKNIPNIMDNKATSLKQNIEQVFILNDKGYNDIARATHVEETVEDVATSTRVTHVDETVDCLRKRLSCKNHIIEENTGASGSLIFLKNKIPLFIFKPLSMKNKGIRGRALFLLKKSSAQGQISFLSKNDPGFSEIAAKILEIELTNGSTLIPETGIAKYTYQQGRNKTVIEIGIAQFWLDKKYKLAKNCSNVLNKKKYDDSELLLFQRMVILDFLLGNLDRKTDNWMIYVEDNKIKNIGLIDNGNSFILKQPKTFRLASRNQYKWNKLEISKQNFLFGIRSYFKEMNDGSINKLVLQINDLYKKYINTNSFLVKSSIVLLKKRAELIDSILKNPTKTSPLELGSCKSTKKINNLIKRICKIEKRSVKT